MPGLFTKMYKRGGIPGSSPPATPIRKSMSSSISIPRMKNSSSMWRKAGVRDRGRPCGDRARRGGRRLGEANVDEVPELPEADDEFDEDLGKLLEEIEAEERQPTG